MIIKRDMGLALLISLLGHIFCIISVSLITIPAGFKLEHFSSVSFLGSILNNPNILVNKSLPETKGSLVMLPAEINNTVNLTIFNQRLYLPELKKQVSPDNLIDIDFPKKEIFSSLILSGKELFDISREVIFKPVFPDYPEWAQQELRGRSVIFNAYVSSSGLLEQLICEQASGNPEIDAALARYIEKWRFASSVDQQGRWRKVKIDLD